MRHASHHERARLCDEAASLIALLHEDDSIEKRLLLYDFLRRSPEHVRAYLAALSAILEFARLEREAECGMLLATRRRRWSPVTLCCEIRNVLKFRWIRILAVISSIAVVATVGYVPALISGVRENVSVMDHSGTYPIGHSSSMTLHQDSEAQLRSFGRGHGEEITLVKGWATFTGEHSQTNPLRVVAYPIIVEMTGTTFDVRRRSNASVDIDVASGDVVLRSKCPWYRSLFGSLFLREKSPLPRSGLHLANGQSASVSGNSCQPHIEIKDAVTVAESASAGMLLQFRDTSVRDAVQIFNRYSATQIIIEDDALGSQKVRGQFLSSLIDSFVLALQKKYNATAIHRKGKDGHDVIYLRSEATGSLGHSAVRKTSLTGALHRR